MGKVGPQDQADVSSSRDVDEERARRAQDVAEPEADPQVADKSRALATQEAGRGQAGTQGAQAAVPAGAPAGASVAPAALVPGLTRTTAPPAGKRFAHLDDLDPLLIPAAYRPEDPTARLAVALLVDGDRLVVHVAVGADHWVTSLSADEAIEALAGKQALAHIKSASELVQKLGSLDLSSQRVRIHLFGAAPSDSFVVLDLLRIARSVGRDTLSGLRPVEAQLVLPDAEGANIAGARLFAGQQVKGVGGKPIGGWFPLPNIPEVRAMLGPDAETAQEGLVAGAFYADGVLQLAVKESEAATTGLVAHINLAYLANKLKAFGDKVVDWIQALLARIQSGAGDLFRSLSLGKLRLGLPEIPGLGGTWFDFDFNLTLPKLFKGGGGGGFDFDLSGLWPTGFNVDIGGFSLGAMPKLSFPWLRAPKLGGFDVPWERFKDLLPDINLPSLQMPSLPSLSFGFHRIGGLKFGFGTDLSLAWPELGDLSLGFTIDLAKILEKLAGAGRWLLNKLKAAGDAIARWIHFGSDGVLRIYDGQRPDGPMIGFHLLKLLDGAQDTDLAPTEMRWTEGAAGIAMELGEAQDASGGTEKPDDKGKGTPDRPGGVLLTERKGITAPASLVDVMSLVPGAKIDVSLHAEAGKLVVFSHAPSTLYDHGQALRTSLDVTMLARRVLEKWQPANGKPPPISSFELDTNPEHAKDGPRVNFALPSAVGMQGAKGYAVWSVDDLLRAKNWTDLAPAAMQLAGEGVGGVQLGKLDYSLVGPPLLGQRHAITSDKLAKKLLRDDDSTVHAGFHYQGDVVGVSLTKEETGDEGLLGHVHLSFLLDKLKRLGDLGRRALEKLAALVNLQGGGGGGTDIFARIGDLAKALGDRLRSALDRLANGILQFDFGGGQFLRWDIKAQLPRLGLDLDLSDLIPEFNFDLPGLPGFSLSFEGAGGFGNPFSSFKLPSLGLRDLLGKLPNLNLPKGDFDVGVSWIGDLLGVSIQLPDLFGTGDMAFGFRVPVDALLEKVSAAGKWLGKVSGKIKDSVHIGTDGVLRIFNPASPSTRVGFDLKQLFDGVDAKDLVPVEAHAEVKSADGKQTLAEVSYGDAYVSDADKRDAKLPDADGEGGGKHAGAVLVPRPSGTAVEHATFTAPAWLRAHLSASENARVHASLYLPSDRNAGMVTLWAVVDGSDRGVEVKINIGALASRGKLPVTADKGLSIDRQASMGRGMLVLGIKSDKVSGHAAWKLSELLQSPSMESLLPDELVLERPEGKLTVGTEIDTSKLMPRGGPIDLSGWDIVASRLGPDASRVQIYTNDFKKAEPRIAIVQAGHEDPDGKRTGIELQLDRELVAKLNTRLKALSKQVRGGVQKILTRGPSESPELLDLAVYAEHDGVKVERGTAGEPWHMYAKWGWQELGGLLQGNVDGIESLMPDHFRVDAGKLAVEVEDLDREAGGQIDERKHKEVGKLHPLLKDTLNMFGVHDRQYIDLGLEHPESKVVDEQKQLLRIKGAVYDVDSAKTITDGKGLTLDVSVQAILSQVVPNKKRVWEKADRKDTAKKSAFSADIDVTDKGVDLEASAGKESKLFVRAGWTFQQILDLLLNLEQVITSDGKPNLGAAAGLLVPDRLHGGFENPDLRIEFGNDGKASSMNTSVDDIPGVSELLGLVLDPATIQEAKLHLNLPGKEDFTKAMDDAAARIKKGELDFKLPLAGCALEVPKKDTGDAAAPPVSKFFQVTLSVAPQKFKALLQLIPGIGQYIKIASLVIDVLKDPVGALEGAMYTPEALYHVFSNAGDTWAAIQEKGWKGIATAMFVNGDMTTKQGVMAGRIHAKMKAAGWTKKGDKIPDIQGVDVKYLEWLAAQDGDKLAALADLGDQMDKAFIEQIEREKPTMPAGGLPDVATIRQRIADIEAGYTEFATAKQAAGDDQTKIDAASDNLRKRVEKAIQAGAAPKGGVDVSGKATTKDAPTQTADREYSDVTDLPAPEQDQAKQAQDIFDPDTQTGDDKDKVVLAMQDAQYLINKYAALSTQQLADALEYDSVEVTTDTGTKRQLPIHVEERPFVRTLFLRRLAAEGVELAKAQDGAGSKDDRALAAAYRNAKARAEREAERAAKANAKGKGSGEGDSGEMWYEDDAPPMGGGGGEGEQQGDGAGAQAGEGEHEGEAGEVESVDPAQGKEPATDPAPPTPAGKGDVEEPEALRDVFRPTSNDARKWMRFDTAAGQATLDEAAIKGVLGLERTFQGNVYRLDEIRLATLAVSGEGRNQTFEFSLELIVTSEAEHRVARRIVHTFVYMPADDKMGTYGGMTDVVGFAKKVNDAVDVLGDVGTVVAANKRFVHEGWDMEVVQVKDVQPRNASQVDALLWIQFHKVPSGSATVRTPDGPKLVRDNERAEMVFPLSRDKT